MSELCPIDACTMLKRGTSCPNQTTPTPAEQECRYGTHAPRDCPARVFAVRGKAVPECPILARQEAGK